MNHPRICVVVPTRERADTLRHTLASCVAQSDRSLDILVCDNASQDDTKAVIQSFDDARVRYINPGRRLSMAENWEFALSHVDADYVTVIGDDDGLLPNAVQDMRRVLDLHAPPVLTWKKVEYCWPSYLKPELRNYVSLPLSNRLIRIRSELALRHMYRFWLGYSKGPCIYNSIVSMRAMNAVRERDGIWFGAYCPDVYSSLALASVTDSYLYSTRPFSVNGASGHSNGTSVMRPDVDQAAAQKFMSEYQGRPAGFADVRGSITAAVMDSLVSFSLRHASRTPRPPFKVAFRRIARELAAWPGMLEENESLLRSLADRHGCTGTLRAAMRSAPAARTDHRIQPAPALLDGDNLTLWGQHHGVEDVATACDLAGRILGDYVPPSRAARYSVAAVAYTRCVRAAERASVFIGI